MNNTPEKIYQEYEKGKEFNTKNEVYDTVEKNQRFYIGDQWHGVNAPGLSKPIFNMIKRVVTFFIANIVSDDIGVNLESFRDNEESDITAKVVSKEIDKVIEKTKLKAKTRKAMRNCTVDGDTAFLVTFNPDIETGQDIKGAIELDIIDNTNIIFGNPYSSDLQSQPYIIISQRLYIDQVKEMAKENGIAESEYDSITADNDLLMNETEENLVTVLTKFYKVKREVEEPTLIQGITNKKTVTEVHYIKTTKDLIIKEDTNLEYRLYPISYMSWEERKRNYHGQSPITGLIPNQIYVNKLFAMVMLFTQNMGFPKLFYDSQKIAQYTNSIGDAIQVKNFDNLGKVIDGFKPPDFSNQILSAIEMTINYTRDMMGASDASLGNVNPNNTSAIIAVQQSSEAPLQLQKLAYYDFVEDTIRIILDIMGCDYGQREVYITEDEAKVFNQPSTELILDFNTLRNINYEVNVDIGSSSYWNETTQITTMDNLFSKGIITDAVTYLEGIPDKYVKNKGKIIDDLKQKELLMEQMQEQQMQGLNQEMLQNEEEALI